MLVWDSQPATHIHTSPKGCAPGCSGNLSFDQGLANIQFAVCTFAEMYNLPQVKDLEKCKQDYISVRDSGKQKGSV